MAAVDVAAILRALAALRRRQSRLADLRRRRAGKQSDSLELSELVERLFTRAAVVDFNRDPLVAILRDQIDPAGRPSARATSTSQVTLKPPFRKAEATKP